MSFEINLGLAGGRAGTLDLVELLATRLLVQGNSGSGKSHLLRRLLEQSAGLVQQAVIDPEGDYVSLAEMTTRKHYPGTHRVEALINGRVEPLGSFALTAT